jgi:hypothetical protein
MDVRLPDGTILRNVPEGTTKAQIMAKIGQVEQSAPRPSEAAANPEVHTPLGIINGESSTGFNPAAYLIQAGDVLDSIGKGGIQAVRGPADWLKQKLGGAPDPGLQAIAQERAEAKAPMKALQDVHPGSAMLGTGTVYALSPNKLAPVVAGMEHGSVGDRAVGAGTAWLGNKLGEKAGQAVGRVLQPTRQGELSATQSAANEAAERLGVKLSSGEATGNRALRWAESATADLPVASGVATARRTGNQKAMNAAALRQLGEKGDEITEAALASARGRISGEYDRILEPAKITLDGSFRHEVKAITGSKVMKELRDEQTDALIGKFKDMPQGKISVSGEWFQQNKTALDSAIRSAYTNGQPAKAQALEAFEDALDRAATRSLGAQEKAAYKTAQRQWATLRAIESGKVVEGGNVMPGRLNSYLEQRYKGAYKEGKIKGELADVAKMGGVLREPANSGTAARHMYTGGAIGAGMFEPMTALSMIAGPTAIQYASPAMRNYMQRGLMNVSPELEKALMLSGGKAGLLSFAADR